MTVRDPTCPCGGSGVRLYQPDIDGEIFEEPCLCIPPGRAIRLRKPLPPRLDPYELQDHVARLWEAQGRGKWDPRTEDERTD